ncbi:MULTISPECIES: hypothetical protein [unclassified Bradyrhizobium]|uniref:hypothetical protein n=1 Tax=unclassified Bradyrhizobium TaxID=2631580 RepID=UPI00211F450C|nr:MULTISPECIES: hypothetical protein [unclassified Bradyrhizobium]MDD1536283.1 hypothetical protein [Bradyrhizobium sp. WBOS8]MDD1586044.1 hypothetical protein [Bradyrhizobium sp. WBOS4]UUO48551.1 hypothetical protein DCM78_17540 [Bradyrhizobium sp. WBOS04]UUO62171.1 hypothetical protein DCM80_25285 [Bradyrhizobium sp. WBOS08]
MLSQQIKGKNVPKPTFYFRPICVEDPEPKAHLEPEGQEHPMPISEELAALIRRAEDAATTARRLLRANEHWRRSVER